MSVPSMIPSGSMTFSGSSPGTGSGASWARMPRSMAAVELLASSTWNLLVPAGVEWSIKFSPGPRLVDLGRHLAAGLRRRSASITCLERGQPIEGDVMAGPVPGGDDEVDAVARPAGQPQLVGRRRVRAGRCVSAVAPFLGREDVSRLPEKPTSIRSIRPPSQGRGPPARRRYAMSLTRTGSWRWPAAVTVIGNGAPPFTLFRLTLKVASSDSRPRRAGRALVAAISGRVAGGTTADD